MIQRAIGYVRVSDPRSAKEGYSTGGQLDAITGYCQAQGWSLSEVLMDDGVSGRLLLRPEVRRLLELADRKAFEVLVLVKLDRSGRQNRIIQEFLDQFRRRGIRLAFVEHASGDTPADRLLLNVLGGVSEFELEQIKSRTMAGRHAKAAQGLIPTNLEVCGYRFVRKWEAQADPSLVAGQLRIHPEEAELVREIYERLDAGATVTGEAKRLNALGIPSTKGAQWQPTRLRRMLQNPIYKGELVWGRQEWASYYDEASGKKRWRVTDKPPEEWKRIRVPPLVPADLWERVQVRIQDQAQRFPGRPSELWPLRGCVVCSSCVTQKGEPRAATGHRSRSGKGYLFRCYECRECGMKRRAETLEKEVQTLLEEYLKPGVLGAQARAEVEAEQRGTLDLADVVERHERDLAQLDQEERGIARMIAAGISAHIVSEQIAELHRRRARAKEQLDRLLDRLARAEDPEGAYLRAETVSAWARELLQSEDPADRQAVFQRLVRVTLYRQRKAQIRILARFA